MNRCLNKKEIAKEFKKLSYCDDALILIEYELTDKIHSYHTLM